MITLVGQRNWKMLASLLAGGAALTATSFAAAGADWPKRYFEILTMNSISPRQQIMPNFNAMLLGVPYQRVIEPLFGLVTAGAVWLVARRTDFAYGLAAALVGGLLISPPRIPTGLHAPDPGFALGDVPFFRLAPELFVHSPVHSLAVPLAGPRRPTEPGALGYCGPARGNADSPPEERRLYLRRYGRRRL